MHDMLNYLYSLERFGIKLGLEVMQKLMAVLDNPERAFKSIHIAGTNGKGSTAAFLASILQEAGYKTGLYTSPHLVRFNERIKINGRDISDAGLRRLIAIIRKAVEENQTGKHSFQPTFFEFTTAMAFLHFAQEKVELAVIETGMGGRLDATNVITPEISIITSIGMEHTQYLGNTLLKIAAEKAGIIKKGIPAVIAEKNQRLASFFRKACARKKAPAHILDEEIHYHPERWDLSGQRFRASFMAGTMTGALTAGKNPAAGKRFTAGENSFGRSAVRDFFHIPLLGQHQLRNAAGAMLAASYLGIPPENIKTGLAKTHWPGRLEIISGKPFILADCAHNAAGMLELAKFIRVLPHRKIILLGISEDKQIPEMVSLIAPLAEEIIISKGNYKPAEPDIIAKEARKYAAKVEIEPQPEKALRKALSRLSNDSVLLATGSIYFVGEILKYRNLK